MSSLLATHRFFAVLALRMEFHESPQVKDLAGDGTTFFYNPDWIAETKYDELKGCIAHIVFACSLKHQLRRGDRDYAKWQRASRVCTSRLLLDNEFWVPKDVCDTAAEHDLDDLPVEIIYDRLPDDPSQQGGGQGAGQGAGGAVGALPPPPGKDFAPDATPDGQGQGQEQGQGDGNGGAGASGEVMDAPGSAEERQSQDQKWDKASKQAMTVTKAAGTDVGRIEQEFEDQHVHSREWEDRLQEYMRAIAPTDYTWARPNRRFIDTGLYLPSLSGEGMGPMVIVIDTSASVSNDRVNRACSEMFAIARDVKPERIHMIQCSESVKQHINFAPENPPVDLKIRGRGGTKFGPAFDLVEEMEIRPDVLVYLTDTGATDIERIEEPDYPVLWGVEVESQLERIPFGDGLVIPDEEAA